MTEIERSNLGLPEIRTARDIVAHFVDFTAAATGQPAPRRVIGMVARYSKELLEDGIDPHVIAKATEIIVERRLHAGLLPTLIAEAALGPRQQLRYGRGMTTQQILDATKGLP